MRKYSYFYEGIYEKKLGIMRRGVAPLLLPRGILLPAPDNVPATVSVYRTFELTNCSPSG